MDGRSTRRVEPLRVIVQGEWIFTVTRTAPRSGSTAAAVPPGDIRNHRVSAQDRRAGFKTDYQS